MVIQGLLLDAPQEVTRKRSINIEACRRGGRARAAQPSFKEACVKGGKSRAAQPSFIEACQKGFAVTCERHPHLALSLKKRINDHNARKGEALGISASAYRKMRIKETGACGMRSPEDFA